MSCQGPQMPAMAGGVKDGFNVTAGSGDGAGVANVALNDFDAAARGARPSADGKTHGHCRRERQAARRCTSPRKPVAPVTRQFTRRVQGSGFWTKGGWPENYLPSFRRAQVASFSRKILALWRVSTGMAAMEQEMLMISVCSCCRPRSLQLGKQRVGGRVASRGNCPRLGSTTMTGVCSPREPTPTSADAEDSRMLVEDCFAGNRVHRAVGGKHAMGDAAAEPEAALVDPGSRSRPCDARTFRGRRRPPSWIFARAFASRRVTYSLVTTGPRTISSPISPGGSSSVAIDRVDRPIDDADHAPLDARKPAADANAAAAFGQRPRFCEHFGSGDRRDRQRFGRAVRRVHFAGLDRSRRSSTPSTRAGTGAPADITRRSEGKRMFALLAIWPNASQTAGEAKLCVACNRWMASTMFCGSTVAGREKSMSRQDGRHAHRSVEKPEQRETGHVDFARLDAVEIADFSHLAIEVAVAVKHALGRAGAAAGEDDGGGIVGGGLWQIEFRCFLSAGADRQACRRPTKGGGRRSRSDLLWGTVAERAKPLRERAGWRQIPPARLRQGSGAGFADPCRGR